MQFEFATASRILFGPGTVAQAGHLVAGMGRRALLVTGASPQRSRILRDLLDTAGVARVDVAVTGEPTLDLVEGAIRRARAEGCDVVVGFGGGSALDTAKAVAAMLGDGGTLLEHLEVIGEGRPLRGSAVPCVAIPTTAGTGSEVTRNAVLTATGERVKVSLRGPQLLPRLALVDPELTYRLPAAQTASSGLDALTQLIEPYTSSRANPLADALCREGIARAARALPLAHEAARSDILSDEHRVARDEMALAALLGGLALANAGLGAVHGFAAAIGGAFAAPHGAVCGALLPVVVEANVRALHEREPGAAALARYDEVARLLTGRQGATAPDGVAWLHELVASLEVPPLARYGITREDVPSLVAAASRASSMRANPVALTLDELAGIIERAL